MTWIQGFGLTRMPLDDLDAACKELRLLIFPGTQVLQKQLLPPLPPPPPPTQAQAAAAEPAEADTASAPTAIPTLSAEPDQAHVLSAAEQTKAGYADTVMTDAEAARTGQAAHVILTEPDHTTGLEAEQARLEQVAHALSTKPSQPSTAQSEGLQAEAIHADGVQQFSVQPPAAASAMDHALVNSTHMPAAQVSLRLVSCRCKIMLSVGSAVCSCSPRSSCNKNAMHPCSAV